MIKMEAKAEGVDQLRKIILVESAASRKALKNAIRTEGFSLRHTMAQAIRMGVAAPGHRLQDLSMIARTINRKSGVRQHKPLLRLASGITYLVDDQGMTMRVGFTKRSPRWVVRAAARQQAGFTRPVTERMRRYMAARGAERRSRRTWKSRRTGNPLMLKKSTTRFVVPPRHIVDPFWDWQRPQSSDRIRKNFRMIMRGQVAPGGVLVTPSEFAGF